MAATQADLDAAIQQEGTDLNTLQTTVQGLIAKLGSNPDFTNEVTQLKAFDAAINALNASASGQPPASTGTASGS